MHASICLVTTGQPSTNPRAVKEADALTAAGCEVRLIGAQWADWADEADERLLASRTWRGEVLQWKQADAPVRFWWTRGRHRAARAAVAWPGLRRVALPAAVSRVTPELTALARRHRADLFIAHNLGALPAAAAAAARWGARLGFDAEDLHSGQFAESDRAAAWVATCEAERAWIPRCDYVTAAAPGIAAAYAPLARRPPLLVRNVFPLADRPSQPPTGSADGVLRLYWFSQTIGPGRGIEDVVRAMGLLPDGSVELHLRGVWWPGFEAALAELAGASRLSPSRLAAHAPADPGEMVRLAAPWDVGLTPETGDTDNSNLLQSNKAYTYLLAGVPLLSSDTAGHREILVEAAGAGWTYPRGNWRALANRLADLSRNRAVVRHAAARAWSWGEVRFNWDVEQRKFLAEIDRVLSDTRRASVA
jgi:glycosyltransferase involved in cell wall biosynthesis